MAKQRQPLREAFDARYRVDQETGCWEWTGAFSSGGYGQHQVAKVRIVGSDRYQRTRVYAHRISWELHYGSIPADREVCHHCDNPPCVNPEHLFLGTHRENMRDRDKKGRVTHGERQHCARLTEFAVREIMASTLTSQSLAGRFGVSMATVNDARRGITWAHLGLTRCDDAKGNQGRPGSAHHGAILTEADIPLIRARITVGEGCTSIGRSFGVSDAVIRNVKSGKTWRNA